MAFFLAVAAGGVIGCILIASDVMRRKNDALTEVEGADTEQIEERRPQAGPGSGDQARSAGESPPERDTSQQLVSSDGDEVQVHAHTRAISRALGGSDNLQSSAEAIGYADARAAALEGAERGEDRKWSVHRTVRYGLDAAVLLALAGGILYLLASETNVDGWSWLERNYPAEYGALAIGRVRLLEAGTVAITNGLTLAAGAGDAIQQSRRWMLELIGLRPAASDTDIEL